MDTKYELPLGYEVTKASALDITRLLPMVEELKQRHPEIVERAKDMSADKWYDSKDNNRELYDKYGIKPVIDIRMNWKDEKDAEIKTRPLYEDKEVTNWRKTTHLWRIWDLKLTGGH